MLVTIDVLDLRLAEHLGQRVREVLDDDDHFGAAVVS